MEAFIEVWVNTNFDDGHVEIKVNGNWFGFWSTAQKVQIAQKTEDPYSRYYDIFKGDLKKLNYDDFTYKYIMRYRLKRKSSSNPNEVPRPRFHIFKIPVSVDQKNDLSVLLERTVKTPPHYQGASKDNNKNCVTLSSEALRSYGILDDDFKIPYSYPSPEEFLQEMRKFKDRNPGITEAVATLSPPEWIITKPK
jgi:hypothetical protein